MKQMYAIKELKEMNTRELYLLLWRNYNKVTQDVVQDAPANVKGLTVQEWVLSTYSNNIDVVYNGTMEHIDDALKGFKPSQILKSKIVTNGIGDEYDSLTVIYNHTTSELFLYRTYDTHCYVEVLFSHDNLYTFQIKYLSGL